MDFSPDYLVYCGAVGALLGLLGFVVFLYRRLLRVIKLVTSQRDSSPRVAHSVRNLVLIILWTSVLGMLMFFGFFLRAYHAFTLEKPVAEIITQPTDDTGTSHVTLVLSSSPDSQKTRGFVIRGDQWMLEGDILKWDNWLNFLGLHTRYRLTRLRGRYILAEEEARQKPTVYSLVKDENHRFWRHLYQYGHKLPFVSTVYGNAVFQGSGKAKRYLVYVGTSGFVVREKEKQKERHPLRISGLKS